MFLLLLNLLFSTTNMDVTLQDEVYYAQYKIFTVASIEQAKDIDHKIKKKKGVLSVHTDYKTSTLFCTYNAEANLSEDQFTSWMHKMGYDIACFNSGRRGDGKMISPHDLKDCPQPLEEE